MLVAVRDKLLFYQSILRSGVFSSFGFLAIVHV